jgi:hypothetical protein
VCRRALEVLPTCGRVRNRGKRGVAIDIANREGREIVLRLAEQADVFLTNFPSEGRQKLGIDGQDVMARNPRIVYGRGSRQGVRGPEADRGGFDGLTYWSRGGVSAALTSPGAAHPVRMVGPGFGDVQSGAMLAGGVAAALFQRERTGAGVVVDSSLLATAMWVMQPSMVAAELTGVEVQAPSIGGSSPCGGPPSAGIIIIRDREDGMLASDVDRYQVIDTDTHVIEPYDLWTSRLSEARWGDRIPQVHWDESMGEDAWYFGADRIGPAAAAAQAGWNAWPPDHPPKLHHLDWQWKNCGVPVEHPEYDLLPSEYFKRQLYGCFWFETDTVHQAIEVVGPDRILYDSDFPHPTSMAPGPATAATTPRNYIADTLGDLPEPVLQKVLHDNAAQLYHLD